MRPEVSESVWPVYSCLESAAWSLVEAGQFSLFLNTVQYVRYPQIMTYFSVRMRSDSAGQHISGAERIVREHEVPAVCAALSERAGQVRLSGVSTFR